MTEMHKAFTGALGVELIEPIVDRRGSLVLKVCRDGKIMALKGVDRSVSDTYDRDDLIRREAIVLRELGNAAGGQYVAHGSHPTYGMWLLLRWVEGETASAAGARIRTLDRKDICAEMRALFVSIAEAYSTLHQKGFLHGDVQAQHVLIEKISGQRIILDWGLARRIEGENPPYKGGFVHYAAPEIARGMLDRCEAISYDIRAEIYSLGALFRFVYTGETAVDYGPGEMMQIPFQQKLKAVSENQLRTLPAPQGECEERLQRVIQQCLMADSKKRFVSVDALLEALQEVKSQTKGG